MATQNDLHVRVRALRERWLQRATFADDAAVWTWAANELDEKYLSRYRSEAALSQYLISLTIAFDQSSRRAASIVWKYEQGGLGARAYHVVPHGPHPAEVTRARVTVRDMAIALDDIAAVLAGGETDDDK